MLHITGSRGRSVLVAGLLAALMAPGLMAQNTTGSSSSTDVGKELEAMRKRIEQLEAELKSQKAREEASAKPSDQNAAGPAVAADAKNEAGAAPILPANFPKNFA